MSTLSGNPDIQRVPIGILPTDGSYTVTDISNWVTTILQHCLANNVPLLSIACDNAPQHRAFIAEWFSVDASKKQYDFPLENWPFKLNILEQLNHPLVLCQDTRHWVRCMVASLMNPRRLMMLG